MRSFILIVLLSVNCFAEYISLEKLSKYQEQLGEHFDSYSFAFEYFERNKGKFIVELGSERVHIIADCLYHANPCIYTIDTDEIAMKRCKRLTKKFGYVIDYNVWPILDFLKYYPMHQRADLLYMNELKADLLEEAKIIVGRNIMSDKGIIVLDCSLSNTMERTIAYFLLHGYKIIFQGPQIILSR